MRPGEIYRLRTDGRPVIIVSREELNRGDNVVAVPVTSRHFERRRTRPNCVPFQAGQFGFTENCVAQAENISFIEKIELDLDNPPQATLDDVTMLELIHAIGYTIASQCEPD